MQAPNIRTVNKITLIGNVYSNATYLETKNGHHLTKFTIVTNDEWIDPNTGEFKSRPSFLEIRMWNNLAKIYADKLTKGTKVYIEGFIKGVMRDFPGIGHPIIIPEIHTRDCIILRRPD